MDLASNHFAELDSLLDGLVDRGLTADQQDRLAELLRDDPAARRYYVRFMTLHARLETKLVPPPALVGSGQWAVGSNEDSGFRTQGSGLLPHTPPIIIQTSPSIHYPLSTISFGGACCFRTWSRQ